jgi:hypothetical protein
MRPKFIDARDPIAWQSSTAKIPGDPMLRTKTARARAGTQRWSVTDSSGAGARSGSSPRSRYSHDRCKDDIFLALAEEDAAVLHRVYEQRDMESIPSHEFDGPFGR